MNSMEPEFNLQSEKYLILDLATSIYTCRSDTTIKSFPEVFTALSLKLFVVLV